MIMTELLPLKVYLSTLMKAVVYSVQTYSFHYIYYTGFIRVREMSGKFKIFQGQGIVREFHNLSGKIEFLLKCQGNVREF